MFDGLVSLLTNYTPLLFARIAHGYVGTILYPQSGGLVSSFDNNMRVGASCQVEVEAEMQAGLVYFCLVLNGDQITLINPVSALCCIKLAMRGGEIEIIVIKYSQQIIKPSSTILPLLSYTCLMLLYEKYTRKVCLDIDFIFKYRIILQVIEKILTSYYSPSIANLHDQLVFIIRQHKKQKGQLVCQIGAELSTIYIKN